ncbi:Transcriptional regulator, Cro family [Lacticaseibacillus paracasei subsp. paracasei Lpp46]|nr:Transcriptional regulator, Cro family [Lacticaseibacillus paracasei subsp. paracasei Lpp46]
MNPIRKARMKKKMTQEEAAKSIGISYSMYAKIENGNRGASQKTMKRMADFFGESVDAFFLRILFTFSEQNPAQR